MRRAACKLNMRNVRVLLVGNDADYFLTHRLPLARRLSELGFDLHVALPFKSDDPRFLDHPFALHRIALNRGSVRLGGELRTVYELYRLFRNLRPTIAHNVTLKPTLYGGLIARFVGVPVVINAMTGLGFVIARGPLRAACRGRGVTMIFQNPEDLETFSNLGISEKSASVLIRGSGVDTRTFRPAEERNNTEPVVAVVSRMLWDKGIGEFVEAARILKREGIRARFILVGGTDPNPSSVPEATLRGWNDEGVIEWYGKRNDIPDVWRSADIACLPSYAEGLPKTLLEAASTGLPMVATDIPGCREIVRPEVTGLLVPKGDAHQLALSLRRLILDPELRGRLGANARTIAVDEFDVKLVLAQMVGLYETRLDQLKAAGDRP
jgi:glycosyltransferase involved in cell wall biosynthesis